ncbi:MAG: GGDEF domain-containing protein [Betaproteobacteria bacterium]|nr:GGDEF domain-containing protein [Betaproteobacteria bacterium]MDH5219619.1 GGDEF domain-containing protein [Betaproteobacteria bacterium]MDH5350007.1 GGDEF domain-containing protein [Betaproteobacteria bacterium]
MVPSELRPALAPAVILVAAALAVWGGPSLPASLSGLRTLGPYAVLAVGVAFALRFNRGRALILLGSLLAAYAGYHYAQGLGGFAEKAVYTALVVLVPLNALVAMTLPERGVAYHGSYRWLVLLGVEALLILWIAAAGRSSLSGLAWQGVLEHWLFRSPPTPLAGRLLFGAAFAAAVWRAWPKHTPLDIGLAAALAAFFIAAEWAASPAAFAAFLCAAGAVVLVAFVQESHRLAFRDELTGLPGRRALDEQLRALGPRYTIAMIDVDHFKKFNDTHGHDIGDQVLKLVAARLAEVGGGGVAFRYGGEEFSVLFAGKSLKEALPYLENTREAVERYKMAVRSDERPRQQEAGIRRRGDSVPTKLLSVTVSMGAAEPEFERQPPSQVLKAADEALYRAKKGGRNRVST